MLHLHTKCSSKYEMISRFNVIRTEICAAADDDNASIRLNTTEGFKFQAQQLEGMLKYFNIATLQLKKRVASLAQCRVFLDALAVLVERRKETDDSPLHN